MDKTHHKTTLIDLTFIIPIRIDSFDRYQNLLLVLKFLAAHCDAPVIILEADEFQHIEQNSLPENVAYYFVADEYEKFHRTHYINQLIGLSTTPYIAIWDTDVLVDASQISESMSWLRTNLCSAVLPYDGRCKDLAAQQKWNLDQTLKLDPESGTLYAEHACGGALIVNKQHFTEAGLCNEYLTSWGPDDVEQKKRLEILGFPIKRTNGILYHLCHHRGINSTYQSDEERLLLMQEYIKIVSMTRSELQEYIKTWEWVSRQQAERTYSCILPVKDLVKCLEYWETASGQNVGLYDGKAGLALGWMTLANQTGNQEYYGRACDFLEQIQQRIAGQNFLEEQIEDLAGVGIACLNLMKNSNATGYCRNIIRHIDMFLFGYLMQKSLQGQKLNSYIDLCLYFLNQTTTEKGYCVYNEIYYKELLVFTSDELNRFLEEELDCRIKGLETLAEKDIKELSISLWALNVLAQSKINQECIKKTYHRLDVFIENYLGQVIIWKTEDIWLLYAYSKIAGIPERKLHLRLWLEDWARNHAGKKVTWLYKCFYNICVKRFEANSVHLDCHSVSLPEFSVLYQMEQREDFMRL